MGHGGRPMRRRSRRRKSLFIGWPTPGLWENRAEEPGDYYRGRFGFCVAHQKFMCGIIGYVGRKDAGPIIIDGLRRLQYRGYDSAGLAAVCDGEREVRKKKGCIDDGLARLMTDKPMNGSLG